jgi:serine/threonine-protein kinase RsbT
MERVELNVTSTPHIERIRREARRLPMDLGFSAADAERVALATTELATNLTRYARNGRMVLEHVRQTRGEGIQIESHDDGPGIADVDRAMTDGFSTGGGLGNGLPGVRRLLDELEITSGAHGTDIVGRRWRPTP